jgi:hypothetical protein
MQVGKDLQDMGAQLSAWAGAMSDLDFADKQCQKPSVFKILGGGVESQALEIWNAKKKETPCAPNSKITYPLCTALVIGRNFSVLRLKSGSKKETTNMPGLS